MGWRPQRRNTLINEVAQGPLGGGLDAVLFEHSPNEVALNPTLNPELRQTLIRWVRRCHKRQWRTGDNWGRVELDWRTGPELARNLFKAPLGSDLIDETLGWVDQRGGGDAPSEMTESICSSLITYNELGDDQWGRVISALSSTRTRHRFETIASLCGSEHVVEHHQVALVRAGSLDTRVRWVISHPSGDTTLDATRIFDGPLTQIGRGNSALFAVAALDPVLGTALCHQAAGLRDVARRAWVLCALGVWEHAPELDTVLTSALNDVTLEPRRLTASPPAVLWDPTMPAHTAAQIVNIFGVDDPMLVERGVTTLAALDGERAVRAAELCVRQYPEPTAAMIRLGANVGAHEVMGTVLRKAHNPLWELAERRRARRVVPVAHTCTPWEGVQHPAVVEQRTGGAARLVEVCGVERQRWALAGEFADSYSVDELCDIISSSVTR